MKSVQEYVRLKERVRKEDKMPEIGWTEKRQIFRERAIELW